MASRSRSRSCSPIKHPASNNKCAVGNDDYDPRELPTDASMAAAQYDDIAKNYDEYYKDKIGWDPAALGPLFAQYTNVADSHLKRIIDAGCGTGRLAKKLRDLGFAGRIDGFDVSREMVSEATAKGVFTEVYVHDLYAKIPCDDAKYDALITTAALMFVQKKGLMHELTRCVKKGGHMLISARIDRMEGFGYVLELNDMVSSGEIVELYKSVAPFSENPIEKYKSPDFHYVTLVYQVNRPCSS